MALPIEDIERRLEDEAQMRRRLVHSHFPQQEDLVDCVETLHKKLADLGPQEMRDPLKLEALEKEFIKDFPQLNRDVYDLLLGIAKGEEHFIDDTAV